MTRTEELDALIAAGWGDIPQFLIPPNWADLEPPNPQSPKALRALIAARAPADLRITEAELDEVIEFFELPRMRIRLEKFLRRESQKEKEQ